MAATVNTCSEGMISAPRRQQILDSYCEYEHRHKRLLRWRALGYSILIYSAAELLFLLSASPNYHIYWYLAALSGIGMSLPLTLLCQLALRKIVRDRNNLSRQLFSAGLRIDEDYQLLTNTTHPRLMAKNSRMAGGQ